MGKNDLALASRGSATDHDRSTVRAVNGLTPYVNRQEIRGGGMSDDCYSSPLTGEGSGLLAGTPFPSQAASAPTAPVDKAETKASHPGSRRALIIY